MSVGIKFILQGVIYVGEISERLLLSKCSSLLKILQLQFPEQRSSFRNWYSWWDWLAAIKCFPVILVIQFIPCSLDAAGGGREQPVMPRSMGTAGAAGNESSLSVCLSGDGCNAEQGLVLSMPWRNQFCNDFSPVPWQCSRLLLAWSTLHSHLYSDRHYCSSLLKMLISWKWIPIFKLLLSFFTFEVISFSKTGVNFL